MAKTAFVTGGTGFVGMNLIEQLDRAGWHITALHRPGADLQRLSSYDVNWMAGDLLHEDSILEAMPEGVDVVFHVAGSTNVWSRNNAEQTRVNVDGTRHVASAAMSRHAGRLVHTSTWQVYGIWQPQISEETPQLGGQSPLNYDRSKYLAEAEIRDRVTQGLDAVIINPSNVIGRYDLGNWSRMIRMVWEQRLPGIPPGAGSFCHAEQVALAHIAAAEHGRTGKNYILGGTDATFLEVVQTIGDITGKSVPSRPLPAFAVRLVGRLGVMAAFFTGREPDITPEGAFIVTASPRAVSQRAVRELGFRPVSIRDMVTDCWEWMRMERT